MTTFSEQFPIVFQALNVGFLQTLKLFAITLIGAIPLGLIIAFGSMSNWAAFGFLRPVVLMLPVPMHWWKELRRGYNQSEVIALGISRELNIPVGHNLVARKSHSTQTKKGSYGRWLNAEGIYGVKNASELSGKHVLVIDDVITTGSTVIHCCEALAEAVPLIKISVLSLATTRLS